MLGLDVTCPLPGRPHKVLPVDPRPHRLGGLAVGQVLAELQQGDQRQAPGRQPRLAEPGEEVGEIGVGEDGAELVTELQQRVALAEGRACDARRPLRHGLDRAGLEHGGPPAWIAAAYPPNPARPTSPKGSRWILLAKSLQGDKPSRRYALWLSLSG